MTIEKLDFKIVPQPGMQLDYEQHLFVSLQNKINELVDVVNNDGYYLAQPEHVSVQLKDIKERLDKLEAQNQEDEPELLPCGWCNVQPTIADLRDYGLYAICCSNLLNCPIRAETKKFPSKEKAIHAWNTRA